MNTKTVTTLALVGGLAYMGYRAKQAAEAVAAASVAAVPAPPNSGPVVNGLSFYQLEGLGGIGSRLKKAAKKATNTVQKATDNKVLRPVLAVATAGGSEMTRAAVNVSVNPKKELMRPLMKRASKNPDRTPAAAGQETVYQDVNGAIITKAQYDAIILAMQTGQPIATTGGWALPAGYISASNPGYQSPGIMPPAGPIPSINQGASPTYTPQPNEELMVNSTQDSDYSADPTGSPGLPGGLTTEVSTPSAQEAAAIAAPESNTGKLLIGTALAAGAAYLAFG